jgi:mannose-1-phosphate guanylyltransferase
MGLRKINSRRYSAPAVCISSLIGKPNETTLILPCDHIFNDNEFAICSKQAFEYLKTNDSIISTK